MQPPILSESDIPTKPIRKKVRRRGLVAAAFLLAASALVTIALSSPFNPVSSIVRTAGFMIEGRLHLPAGRIGQVLTDSSGRDSIIFREIRVDPVEGQPEVPGAILIVQFENTNLRAETNQSLSLILSPLYIGNPGFRSILFSINGEACQMVSEWDRVEDARGFAASPALKAIGARSVPGSLSYEIIVPEEE